jgi:hypothetical protein
LLLGLVLAFANWKTLVVLVVAIPLFYLMHTRIFKPIGDRFVQQGLPKLIDRYRTFLEWMLSRDYSVKHAMLRNVGALGALTGGVFLLILGGLVQAAAGQAAGMILLVPGGLLAVLGVLGVLVHTFESLYLGGKTTLKAGLAFGAVTLVIGTLMVLSPREIGLLRILELQLLPALIIVAGLAGMFFNRSGRRTLIQTDNRSRLLSSTLGVFVLVIGMYAVAPTGVEFFPTTDPNLIRVTMEAPLGTNIEASDRIAAEAQDRIDQLIEENPEVRQNIEEVLVNVGVSADADFGGGASSPERSRVTLNLVDYAERVESSQETLRKLREQLQGLPGVTTDFGQDEAGPPTGAPVNIEISGPEFEQIRQIVQDVRQRLEDAAETGAIPNLVDLDDNLNTGRPELQVDIDRERAARFGLNTAQIAQTVRSAINGAEAGKYRTGEDEYDITVRLAEQDRGTLESVENLTILYEGQQIPITAVADFDVGSGLGSVTRLDLQRVATITGDVSPGANAQAVLGQVQQYLSEYREQLPRGYSMEYTGENEEQQESFGFLGTALGIGIALIFLIMIAQFNNVSAPLIIMVAVGLSFLGVMLGLMLTQTPFGLMTFIGVISLAGIVVNNNIVLVDYVMQLRQRGLDKQAAIIEGGATRLRPVALTALTTILGLVPLTFGINVDFVGLLADWDPAFQIGSENTQFWGPMGTAIISGLTFATFLTLVIVPVMYSAFDSLAMRTAAFFGKAPTTGSIAGETATSTPELAEATSGPTNGYRSGDGVAETPEEDASTVGG